MRAAHEAYSRSKRLRSCGSLTPRVRFVRLCCGSLTPRVRFVRGFVADRLLREYASCAARTNTSLFRNALISDNPDSPC